MKTRALILPAAIAALSVACGPSAEPVPQVPPPPPIAATPIPTAAPTVVDVLATAPLPGPQVTFTPPKIDEAKLANGLRVLVVERHDLPIVAVQISIDRGADQATPGLGAFVGGMLLQGTKTRGAIALSDAMESLGGSFGAWVDYDSANVSAQVLTQKLPDALALLADILEHPAFDAKEIERERAKRLTALAQENDSPGALLTNAINKELYSSSHPYGVSLLGDEAGLKHIDASALKKFHAAHFQPDHATIAIAGDVTKARAVAEIEKALGSWSGKAAPSVVPGEPAPPEAAVARMVLVDRSKASQSQVALALPGVPRTSPDFDALLMMNTLLGGQFSSRLNMNLREKHAYTYGANSSFDFRHGPGPFRAGGAIMRNATAPAAREIFSEIDRIRTKLVGEDELADAKANQVLQLPARFETASSTANTVAVLSIYGLPLDEFATRPARLARVTREDVKRVAEKYLNPDRARLVVVGDASAVKEGLTSLAAERHLTLDVRAMPKKPEAEGKAPKPPKK